MPDGLYPFRSPLGREALRDALNGAGPLSWAVRDSIYYGAYLRAWHERAGKLRIFGDGPLYLLDLGDDPLPATVQELDAFIQQQLVPAAQAVADDGALEMLPFPAAPLDLYDDRPPRDGSADAGPWAALADSFTSADPAITIVAFQVGTPASFYSENPRQPSGHHFDMCGRGTTDTEIDLHSPELVARMMARTPPGEPDQRIMRSGEWAFFKNEGPAGFYREVPQLAALARKWGDRLERDIEFRLRLAAQPVASIKTPGQGGPIELFRVERKREAVAAPAPAQRGLWQRVRSVFGSGDSSPPAGTIEVDEAGVRRWLRGGKCEAVKWDALARVEVMTTDQGPAVDDVFWVLSGADGTGCVIPSEAEQADALLARLQELPGFDNEALIEAMSCSKNARFLLWTKGG